MLPNNHDRKAAQRRGGKSPSTGTRRMVILLAFLWLGSVLHVVAQSEPQFRIDDPIRADPDNLEFDKPAMWRTQQIYDVYENLFLDRGDEAQPRAVNVNTLGEVPDSSWFNNRIGARSIGIDEIVTGPNLTGGPAPGPFTVIGRPTGGVTPKFLIEDTAGQRFILKFDPIDYPELASSVDMICSKLFWAAGYNVAEGYITTLTKDRLLIGEGAVFENELGEEILIIQEDIDAWMENTPTDSGGVYRAQASKFVSGEQIGEFRFYGTRSDDPNDIFPHEHRRELRGYRVLAAWLNHDDSRATNTYDAFVGEGDRGSIEHYLLDFGSCLGSASIGPNLPRGGHEYFMEKGPILKSMATLSTSVETTKTSASSLVASRPEARSLSITASTPTRYPFSLRTTGIPPPPQATTTYPPRTRQFICSNSRISRGAGDGTTRRQPPPGSSAMLQPRSTARRRAVFSSSCGPIGLVGSENVGSSESTNTWVTTAIARRSMRRLENSLYRARWNM